MNMFAFIQFNKEVIAAGIEERTGRPVGLGRLNWHADSYHIYGKDIADAKKRLFDRLERTDFENRTYRLSDPMIREMYDEAEAMILRKIEEYDAAH
jgi:thymidylate synthase